MSPSLAPLLSRRALLRAGASLLAAGLLPAPALAARGRLTVERREIDVLGRAASVYGLRGPDGRQGLALDPGALFDLEVANALDEPTIVHWHGQEPPPMLDGGPLYFPLQPGSLSRWTFVPRPGTHWMHSHHGLQDVGLMSAPLIVRRAEELAEDRQELVILLNDFSFTPAEEIMRRLTGGAGRTDHGRTDRGAMDHGAMAQGAAGQGATGHAAATDHGGGLMAMPMDLNDVDYDAYLANLRTLEDPEVRQVERGGRLRLRVINASSGTGYFLDLGTLQGRIVAIDGNPTRPLAGSRFPLTVAQRLDVLVDLPDEAGAWPLLFLREGGRERSGVILATPGAAVSRLDLLAETAAGPLAASEVVTRQLRAVEPLAARAADRRLALRLTGSMEGYRWGLEADTENGLLQVRSGERVELVFDNRTGMAHPMHLHGHHFQLVAVAGAPVGGPLLDTILVPPDGSVTVAFEAANPGRWPLHCHLAFHMDAGMMTTLEYLA